MAQDKYGVDPYSIGAGTDKYGVDPYSIGAHPSSSPAPETSSIARRALGDTAGDSAFKNTTSHASITATQQQVVSQPQIAPQATHATSTTPAVLCLIGVIAVMIVFWLIQKSKNTVSSACHIHTDFDTLAKDAFNTSDLNAHTRH